MSLGGLDVDKYLSTATNSEGQINNTTHGHGCRYPD